MSDEKKDEFGIPVGKARPTINDLVDIHEAKDKVLSALRNAEKFNLSNFALWLKRQPEVVKKTAADRPPNKIYEGPGAQLYYIYGYHKTGGLALRHVFEPPVDPKNPDAASAVVHADPSEIRDVTADLRAKYRMA